MEYLGDEVENFGGFMPHQQREKTGRQIVVMAEDAANVVSSMRDVAGLNIASTEDAGVMMMADVDDGIYFPDLGISIVDGDPDQVSALSSAASTMQTGSGILAVEDEYYSYALGADPRSYIQGYRDGVNHMSTQLLGEVDAEARTLPPGGADSTYGTWGLEATGALETNLTGSGTRVAVLDTGLDLDHPDFQSREVTGYSFIEGETVADGHGHGTHCVGTACGSHHDGMSRRYGVATEADIYVGKVLSDAGRGPDGGILEGLQWAIQSGCDVVSMSLGRSTEPNEPYSRAFEKAAERALKRGTLVVAAAGNDSRRRRGEYRSVSHPANCPSILAVGAVDRHMRVAHFSNRGTSMPGGQVDIVGPGVNVYSSWTTQTTHQTRYRTISGTSMATPHVAGIAALIAGARKQCSGLELWGHLTRTSKRLRLSSIDAGSGLVRILS